MALTVGELNGIITIDDRTVEPALRRVENALRASGRQMGDDAEQAGQRAGDDLGDGIVQGVNGRLRDARGRFVATGRQAGDAVGEGLADGTADGADSAVAEAEGGLSRLQTVALGVGVAAGAVLMDALGQALEQSQITARLGATLGKTPAEAQRYGQIAGKLYADAITTDFQQAADTIGNVMGSGLVPADATNTQIESISRKVADLANTFDQDLVSVTNAATQMIRTGLAKNSTEALDLIAKGFSTSANKADDFLDTINEYGTQFRKAGIDGATAIGLLNQAIGAGARDADIAADAIKEFSIRAIDGSEGTADGFKALGLNADDMAKKFAKGGTAANGVLDLTLDKLRGVEDPVKQSQIAVALFGTQAEDLGRALLAMDPSKAADGIGKVGGSADKLGSSLRDNAGAQVEAFRRQAMQKLVDFLGTKAIPALIKAFDFVQEHSTAFKVAGAVIAGVLVPALALMGVTATVAAGRVMWGWIASGAAALKSAAIQVGSALRTAGAWALMQVRAVGAFAAVAGAAVLNAARTAGAWLLTAARMTGTFLVAVLRVAVTTVAQFALMAARAVAWAATMAAQWLIAMGPIGWVIAAVVGLVALIIANWDKVKKWTGQIWNWVSNKVRGAVSSVATAVSQLSKIPGMVADYFGRMKDRAVQKALDLVKWMQGLPGRIKSGVGDLGSILVTKGVQVVQGLWNGIKSMGGWIYDKIIGWAKSMIPGPIAKALGIASPSKVTKAQGRWIARGLIDGLTGSSKQVKAASTKLADIVRDSLAPGKKRSRALKRISGDTKKLLKLAGQEERVATRLKTAQKRLADQIKARDKLAADVKKGILDSANITGQDTGGWPQTAESILAGLKQDRAAAEAFAKNLATLRKKGVRADLIAQIAQAGVEQGSSAAAALANANASQIKQINAEQAALVKTAGTAGNAAGNAMYGAGIQAANGMVKGLQSRQKQIEKQMLQIAKGMSKAIRKALGIKSPSRVMAQVGAYTVEGLRQGIEGGRRAVNRSMASLVDTPAAGSWDMASGRARAAAAQKVVLEFRSSGRGEDDYLMGRMRRGIRKVGGPDVDFALTGRRRSG